MKKMIVFFIAAALVTSAGCKKHDIRKSATLNLDFEIDATTDSALTFQLASNLRTLTNDAIAEVKDDISRYELKSIKYSVWELYGNDSCVFNGSLGIRKIGDAASTVYYSYNNFNFDPIEEKVEIPFTDSDKAKLEDFLLQSDGLEFVLEGSLSHKPIHFVLNVELNVDAIAHK